MADHLQHLGHRPAGRRRVTLLTGDDPVPARHPRGDPCFYDPQFKRLLHTNHKPKIRGQDKGIRRRVKRIPFTVTIPEGERPPSPLSGANARAALRRFGIGIAERKGVRPVEILGRRTPAGIP